MTEKYFVDTNVIIYAHDYNAGAKHKIASERLVDFWQQEHLPAISIQVLQETYAVLLRKKIPIKEINEIVEDLLQWNVITNSKALLLEGMGIQNKYKISIWDALIIAAAKEAHVKYILSEDLSDHGNYEGIKIINPFKS